MRIKFFLFFLAVFLFPLAPQAQGLAIKAVVNDNIVTEYDVTMRSKLSLFTRGAPVTDEAVAQIAEQTLQTLVDEVLQAQEAKRLGVAVSDAELNAALEEISSQNKLSLEETKQLFARQGIAFSTLEAQVKTGLAWAKAVRRRFASTTITGDEEINEEMEKVLALMDEKRYLLAEIFIEDKGENRDVTKEKMIRIIERLQNGDRFSTLAREESSASSAANGGDMGWVLESELPEVLKPIIDKVETGQITKPLEGEDGIGLYFVRRKSDDQGDLLGEAVLTLKQLWLPFAKDASIRDTEIKGRALLSETQNCNGLDDLAAQGYDVKTLQPVAVKDLPPKLKPRLQFLQKDKSSDLIKTDQGFIFFMVCEREDPSGLPDRDDIARRVQGQKLEQKATQYLRDLRLDANIEMR